LLAWAAYWTGLILLTVGPAITAILRLSQDPNSHGAASAGFANDVISMTVTQAGVVTYTGSVSLLTLVLLTGGPPIIIWLLWFVATARTNNAGEAAMRSARVQNELHAADPRTGIVDASNSKRSALKES
jgi:threonine/homoserine/homoserine lactone efflux protein